MTNTELSGRLMPTVSDMLAKEQRKGALEGLKNSVVHEYALIAHSGGEPEAEQELGRHRRDQLTFERNTGTDSNTGNNTSTTNIHSITVNSDNSANDSIHRTYDNNNTVILLLIMTHKRSCKGCCVSRSLRSTCSMSSDTLVHSLVLVLAYGLTFTRGRGTGD